MEAQKLENRRLNIIFICLMPVFVIGCWFITTAFRIPLAEWFIAGAVSGYVIDSFIRESKQFQWKHLMLYLIFIMGGWPTFCLMCIGLMNKSIKRTPLNITIAIIGIVYLYCFDHKMN